MQQSHWTRTAVSAIIAIVVVYLISLTFPPRTNQVQGLLLPEKELRTPTDPSLVMTYTDMPLTAIPIGHIHLSLHLKGDPAQKDFQAVQAKAQEIAAQYGANALVIQTEGIGGSGPFHALIYNAQAIYVPKGGL